MKSSIKSKAKRLSDAVLGPMGYEIRAKDQGDAPYAVTPGVLTEDLLRLNRAAAVRQAVESAVHPCDYIYFACIDEKGHTWSGVSEAVNYYFENGGVSANKLADIVSALGYEKDRRISVLEFASGYGCVSRHLKKNARFDLTSCDIHPAAIDFLDKELGVRAIPSVAAPEEFSPAEKYDVVFALSFFSHMPRSSFGRWLRALFGALKSPGHLVFTAHGHKHVTSMRLRRDDMVDGFWFRPDSEQKDLDTAEYGTTVSTPEFVVGEIYRQTGAPIAMHKHAFWWEYQDLWVVKRQ